jgi:hypothetical protein
VQSNHFLVISCANDLVCGRLFVLCIHHGKVHGFELRLVNFDLVAVLFAGFGLGETDRTDFWVREDDGGDILVLEVCVWLVVEEAVRQAATSGDGDGCELETAVTDVADGVDVGKRGILVFVGYDVLQSRNNVSVCSKSPVRGW